MSPFQTSANAWLAARLTTRGSAAWRLRGEHIRQKVNYKARVAADLHARSAVGCNPCYVAKPKNLLMVRLHFLLEVEPPPYCLVVVIRDQMPRLVTFVCQRD